MSKETPLKEIKVGDKILRIYSDDMADSPRSWDNLAKMIFFGRNHAHLGDKHNVKIENSYSSRQDFIDNAPNEIKKQIKGVVICKAVHLYEHSGISISTGFSYPFNCQWDSGTVGFVVVTKEDIKNNWSVNRVTKKLIEQADKIAEGEVETLNQYITNDIYRFELVKITTCSQEHEHEECLDSCGGFYGSDFANNGIADDLDEEFKKELKAA